MVIIILTILTINLVVVHDGSGTINLNAPNNADTFYSYSIVNYPVDVSITQRAELVQIGDGKLSSIWDDVPSTIIPSFGDIGKVKSIHDNQHVFFYFEADYKSEWIAIQIDSDESVVDPENYKDEMEPMANGDDFWVWGTFSEISFQGDGSSAGTSIPFANRDGINDLYWEIHLVNDTDGNPLNIIYEVKRKLNTNDQEGADAIFRNSLEQNTTMLFASSSFHRPDTALTVTKFVIGGKGLDVSGQTFEPIEPELIVVREVPLYTFTHLSIGIFILCFTIFTTTVPAAYIYKKKG